jgi:hypothetical protein
MAATEYDVIINGTKAKVKEYHRRAVRREIVSNVLGPTAISSREDQAQLYQTSWAAGAKWWKPNLAAEPDSFYRSNHMDTWSEPGKVIPANQQTSGAETNIHDNGILVVGAGGDVYAIGETNTTNASFKDIYKWTPASNAFVRESAYHSGIADAEGPIAAVYDPNDLYFYTLSDGNDIERFQPSGSTQSADWIITGFTIYTGANIFLHNQELMFYDGEKVYTVDKTVPDVAVAYNDGMGPEALNSANSGGTNDLFLHANIKLAIATPQGIYYAKNVSQGGQNVAWVFRVEKDERGVFIGRPITVLPVGTVVLGMQWHLGHLILSTSPDAQKVFNNDAAEDYFEVVLYFAGSDGLGALGSVLGGREELEDSNSRETPFMMLGSRGPYVYIAGQDKLWVYDAIRGGLHGVLDFGQTITDGVWSAMAYTTDSASDPIIIWLGKDVISRQKIAGDDPDTVVAFGDDETHYTLESNFSDANLPMELKELTGVKIIRDPGDGDQEWTVQVETDDSGTFADILVHSTASEVQASADLSGTTGYLFRYKLIYQTKDTNRNALKAVLLTFTTGEMIPEWELVLDGTEFLNVDNEIQDPEDFYDAMVTLSGTETVVTYVDNYQELEQLTDDATTTNVKVMGVEINKDTPGESEVRVVIREP